MRFIVIIRYLTIQAWRHTGGKDVASYCEFVPGQKVQVHSRDGNCFRLKAGWAEFPPDAWVLSSAGV